MTRVLFWKELREQGTILIALNVLGAATLGAIAALIDPIDAGRSTELRSLTAAGKLGLVMLVLTAGVVCGGTLFAGETELGTFAFLDRLPGSRWRIWWRKVVVGAGMSAASASVLFAAAALFGQLGPTEELLGWALLTFAVAAAAFGWGALGSVLARSSLAACGLGLMAGATTGIILYPLLSIILYLLRQHFGLSGRLSNERLGYEIVFMTTVYTLIVIPIPIGGWLFTAPDRGRKLAELGVTVPRLGDMAQRATGRRPSFGFGGSYRRLAWLIIRQMKLSAGVLFGVGVITGLALLPEDLPAIAAWPLLGIFAGVLAAVVSMTDEQTTTGRRFWGERRLPVGRLWLMKLIGGGVLTLVTIVGLLLPALIVALIGKAQSTILAAVFRSGLFADPAFPAITYVLLWPIYGYAFGHFAAVVFPKGLVAGAVGLLLSSLFASIWLPSLLSGGLHPWQVLLPPTVAVLTARGLVWAWTTDRLGTTRPLTWLATGSVLAVVATLGGVAYRVAEVPVTAEIDDHIAYARSLPTFDDLQTGRDYRRAISKFDEVPKDSFARYPNRPLIAEFRRDPTIYRPVDRPTTFQSQLPDVLYAGWPANRPDLDEWLDNVLQTKWDAPVIEAAGKPLGVIEDPNEFTTPFTQIRYAETMQRMGPILLVEGLRQQAAGDSSAFVTIADAWLAASRNLRNSSGIRASMTGRALELSTYQAADRWLEHLAGHPDLLRQLLVALDRQDQLDPFDPQQVQLAEQVIVANALQIPTQWLPRYFAEIRPVGPNGTRHRYPEVDPISEVEGNLVGFAWAVPWEQARRRRVLGMCNAPGRRREQWKYLAGLPGSPMMLDHDASTFGGWDDGQKQILTARRALRIMLAIRLYRSNKGSVPPTLDALVPNYLTVVPSDPYDQKPFRYRVSGGEQIELDTTLMQAPNNDLPPGLSPTSINGLQFQSIAGVGGGMICWPLDPDWSQLASPQGMDAGLLSPPMAQFVRPRSFRPTRLVRPGQAVIWSVGPDSQDEGGIRILDLVNARGRVPGDLVFIVPEPAALSK